MKYIVYVWSLAWLFLVAGFCAFSAYLRIHFILKFLDQGLENPPIRTSLNEKLRAYRDWCRDTQRAPVLLYLFAISAVIAVLSWTPIPWLLYH